jgi:hypothetical protein
MHLAIRLANVAEIDEGFARFGTTELVMSSLLTVPAVFVSVELVCNILHEHIILGVLLFFIVERVKRVVEQVRSDCVQSVQLANSTCDQASRCKKVRKSLFLAKPSVVGRHSCQVPALSGLSCFLYH